MFHKKTEMSEKEFLLLTYVCQCELRRWHTGGGAIKTDALLASVSEHETAQAGRGRR